jgi:hypothetical protein
MKTIAVILGITLALTITYAARDLTCYEVIEPSVDYVQADSAIIPTLGIANLGDQAELNFPVRFVAIDTYGKLDGVEHDTVYAETIMVAYIGPYPDSIEVEFPEWTPEGVCHETEPFVFYELMGVAELGYDEDQTNDTTRHNITCLLDHDVGAIDYHWPEEPDELPDHYAPGSKITVTATVENFGFHKEYDVVVSMQVRDVDSNDVRLWHNRQRIDSLDWRGNEDEQPYTAEITFPPYKVINDHHVTITCRTEMEDDQCPDNDECVHHISGPPDDAIETSEFRSLNYKLETPGKLSNGEKEVRFAVPRTSWVKLDVFDASGRWVTSLANDIYEAGHYTANWNSCDAAGRKAATGVYLIHMQADEFKAFQKIVILK